MKRAPRSRSVSISASSSALALDLRLEVLGPAGGDGGPADGRAIRCVDGTGDRPEIVQPVEAVDRLEDRRPRLDEETLTLLAPVRDRRRCGRTDRIQAGGQVGRRCSDVGRLVVIGQAQDQVETAGAGHGLVGQRHLRGPRRRSLADWSLRLGPDDTGRHGPSLEIGRWDRLETRPLRREACPRLGQEPVHGPHRRLGLGRRGLAIGQLGRRGLQLVRPALELTDQVRRRVGPELLGQLALDAVGVLFEPAERGLRLGESVAF